MVMATIAGEALMLISHNVNVNGRRTSMRLEKETWEALDTIIKWEGTNLHDLCSKIDRERKGNGLTLSVRIFVVAYFRSIAIKQDLKGNINYAFDVVKKNGEETENMKRHIVSV